MESKSAIFQLEELEKRSGAPMRLAAEGWGSEWQILVAIIMSARTRDEVTIVVAEKLFAKYKTVVALASASATDVAKIIHPVNFFRNKTKSVVGAAKVLAENFGGIPPHEMEKLLAIPGVGRKTANVFLSEVGKDAVGVDTHVAYISQKLGWTAHTNPHKIEGDLKKLFPQNYWRRINTICVRFGKTHLSRRKKDELLAEIKTLE